MDISSASVIIGTHIFSNSCSFGIQDLKADLMVLRGEWFLCLCLRCVILPPSPPSLPFFKVLNNHITTHHITTHHITTYHHTQTCTHSSQTIIGSFTHTLTLLSGVFFGNRRQRQATKHKKEKKQIQLQQQKISQLKKKKLINNNYYLKFDRNLLIFLHSTYIFSLL